MGAGLTLCACGGGQYDSPVGYLHFFFVVGKVVAWALTRCRDPGIVRRGQAEQVGLVSEVQHNEQQAAAVARTSAGGAAAASCSKCEVRFACEQSKLFVLTSLCI